MPVDQRVGERMVAVLDDEAGEPARTSWQWPWPCWTLPWRARTGRPGCEVPIDLDVLTVRVMEQYWGQLRPSNAVLRQSSDGRSVILSCPTCAMRLQEP